VDPGNFPYTYLVSSPAYYGHHSEAIFLVCNAGGGQVPETAYPPLGPTYPIRARVTDAKIIKVFEPSVGIVIPIWHLEIEAADQVHYFHVINDTTEVPIV
jgi:hypothetical protein